MLLFPFHLQAYAAWLGFYNSAKGMGWDKPTLVQQANRFASECRRPPCCSGQQQLFPLPLQLWMFSMVGLHTCSPSAHHCRCDGPG